MRIINDHVGGAILRIGFGVLLLLQWAVAGEDYGVVNIAAARNIKDPEDRPRHVFYQDPTGNIFVRSNTENWLEPILVTTVDPKDQTPLSAYYYTTNDLAGLFDFEQKVPTSTISGSSPRSITLLLYPVSVTCSLSIPFSLLFCILCLLFPLCLFSPPFTSGSQTK